MSGANDETHEQTRDGDELPPFLHFPRDMKVAQVPCVWAVNQSKELVWLWLRWPNMTLAVDFAPDAADNLAIGLAQAASDVRQRNLHVVKNPLLGPDGKPV